MRQTTQIKPQKCLVMTYQMREALQILEMPQLELGAYLSEQTEKNPLLCEAPKDKPQFLEQDLEAKPSIYDHLQKQIEETFLSESDRNIAMNLFKQMDERGFLSDVDCSPNNESILRTIKSFDPPGIFAKNLQECFLLQLNPKSDAYCLVRDHFQDFMHQRFSILKKKYPNLSEIIKVLSRLQTRPLDAFNQDFASPIVPDLLIEKRDASWEIRISDEELPHIFLNNPYQNAKMTEEESKTLTIWMAQGRGLLNSLSRRKEILIQIGIKIVQRQARYLLQTGPLQSLTIDELSSSLDFHKSTISRAISGKYAATPRGIIPLRSLISFCPEKLQAKELLRELILTENKSAPLCDNALADQLQKRGHVIARRTVSKYRKELRILSEKRRQVLRNKITKFKSI